MSMVGLALTICGLIVALIGLVQFLVAAFREGIGWGLGVLFLAPVGLVFLVRNWQETKKSFFVQLGGLALIVVGSLLTGMGANPGH